MFKKYLLLIFLFASFITFADGCYIPEKAIKDFPSITAQRAAISYKDGRETLVISSTLDSESQELGWIIPLPSVPDVMEKVEPGRLKTLSFLLQPKIIHDMRGAWFHVLTFIWLSLLIRALLFDNKFVIELMGFSVILAVLILILFGTAGGFETAPPSSQNITEVSCANVGAYKIKVISAKKAEDLNRWLAAEKMGVFGEKGLKIASNYIDQNWCFAAIKLRREEKGENTPHPIKFSFKTDRPVYPMKLTTLSDSRPYFEIFVIAEDKFSHLSLKTEYCDRFKLEEIADGHRDIYMEKLLNGQKFKAYLDDSRFEDLIFDNAVVTKLSGELNMAEVTDDLYFQQEAFAPYREKLYSTKAKLWMMAYMVAPFFFVFYVFFSHRQKKMGKGIDYFLTKFTRSFALVWLFIFLIVQKLPSSGPVSTENDHWTTIYRSEHYEGECRKFTKEHLDKLDISKALPSELHQRIIENFSLFEFEDIKDNEIANPITGRAFVNEATPGNFYVWGEEGRLKVELIDAYGKAELLYPPRQ